MTSPALQFRAATAADIGALVALVQSAYRGESSRIGWTTEADLLDGQRTDAADIAACLTRDRSTVLIAVRSGTVPGDPAILACAHIAIETDPTVGETGYFGMFAVRPELQGAGIGKALLAEAERMVRDEWRLPMMRMSVIDVRDELIAFYQRHGYRRSGVYKSFPYGDERFGIPRRDDLRFEILEKPLQARDEQITASIPRDLRQV
ncbi:MAG: N-acetyltransferase [Lysobacter sp.]